MNVSPSGTMAIGRTKFGWGVLCLSAVFIIGDVDYLTGYKISMLVFYILPVGFATIYVGSAFAAFLAILSISISVASDFWSGLPFSEAGTVAWNATIALSLFFIVVGFLHMLTRILLRLERSVEQKTQDLVEEMRERGRLQREIIELSEREQRHFGQELHDVVCQELASVSIATRLLARKLVAAGHDERVLAGEIATMADHALESTRHVARGFFTAGFDNSGLEEALREAARRAEKLGSISCSVEWPKNLTIGDEDAVIHLFRIAQESIQNAVKHAGASRIKVSLERQKNILRLMIEDDGKGLSYPKGSDKGLGLRIMAYRAALIGGELKTEHPDGGGTRIVCLVPSEKLNRSLVETAP